MNLSESINEIKTHILVAESELNSLIAGRKASASRVRKSLQEVKKLSHLLRKGIIEHVKLLPVKTRPISTIDKPTPENTDQSKPPTANTDRPKPTPANTDRQIDRPSSANIVEPKIVFKKNRPVKRDPSL
jgi:hypothetical protein